MDEALKRDIVESCEARATFYRFLASLFLHEVTDEQIASIAQARLPQDDGNLGRGYGLITEFIRRRDAGTRQRLAVDYAHVFLGAGSYDALMAPPFESVYTSEGRLLMQDARDEALACYRSAGLDLPPENVTPEDHVGFEMQFIAELADRIAEAVREGDGVRFALLAEQQRSFFSDHLANWLPLFADDIDRHCSTNFYHGVAALVRGLLSSERSAVDDLAGIGREEAA